MSTPPALPLGALHACSAAQNTPASAMPRGRRTGRGPERPGGGGRRPSLFRNATSVPLAWHSAIQPCCPCLQAAPGHHCMPIRLQCTAARADAAPGGAARQGCAPQGRPAAAGGGLGAAGQHRDAGSSHVCGAAQVRLCSFVAPPRCWVLCGCWVSRHCAVWLFSVSGAQPACWPAAAAAALASVQPPRRGVLHNIAAHMRVLAVVFQPPAPHVSGSAGTAAAHSLTRAPAWRAGPTWPPTPLSLLTTSLSWPGTCTCEMQAALLHLRRCAAAAGGAPAWHC